MVLSPSKPETRVETKTVEKIVEKPVEKVVYKTPPSCITALDIAGNGYGKLATALQTGNANTFTDYITTNQTQLSEASSDCRSKQ